MDEDMLIKFLSSTARSRLENAAMMWLPNIKEQKHKLKGIYNGWLQKLYQVLEYYNLVQGIVNQSYLHCKIEKK